ncbi:MAG: hypothetical protein GC200_05215 [Tepidisphaera sp.]|nr:hypothetical protein [Tepidisphaera sp.]
MPKVGAKPGSRESRLRRWRGHPALAAALLLIVTSDFVLVAALWSQRQTPLARLVLRPQRGASDRDIHFVIESDAGPKIFTWDDSADEISRALQEHPETAFAFWRQRLDRDDGFLAPWSRTRGARYLIHPFDVSVTHVPERVSLAAREYIATHYMPHEDATTSNLDDPPRTQTRLDWPGILHDLIMLPLAAVAIVNLFFVPAYLRRRRRERRLAQGVCPACRYSLAGLPAGAAACPECGQALPAAALPAPPP